MARIIALTLALLAALAAAPAAAQTSQQIYEVRFGGLRVARLILAVREDGAAYAVAGRAESTGLVALFRSMRFDMQASGRLSDGLPEARSYVEDVDTGRRASTVTLRFESGVPVVEAIAPAGPRQPWDVEPADQTGTIDPLSALYRLTRPRGADALCDWRQQVFDGRRRSELALAAPEAAGEAIRCAGHYRRLAGFPPEDMAERTDFPFAVTFAPGPDGSWMLAEVSLQSLYGPVEITRLPGE